MATKSQKLQAVLTIAAHGQNAQLVPQYKPTGDGAAVIVGYEVQWSWEPPGKTVGDKLRESDPSTPKEVVVLRYRVTDPEDIAWCSDLEQRQKSIQMLAKH
jgi:hypothetical protein